MFILGEIFMKKLNLYFIRHGQTILNKYNRMQGWCDSPLTEQGLQQANKTGEFLQEISFQAAYSSDTMRSSKTAEIILEKNKHETPILKTTKYFREEFYGYFEGADSDQTWFETFMPISGYSTFHEFVKEHDISETKDRLKSIDPFNDAENDQEFWDRLNLGFEKLLDENNDGDTVLIVSHGTTIRSLAAKADKNIDISKGPGNASISKFNLTEQGLSITEYNKLPK